MLTNAGKILVDYRENKSKVPEYLKSLGISFQLGNLPVDYIVNRNCFIERKTVADFITSIADGRLFQQV